MVSGNGKTRPCEKGLLTTDNGAVALIDHQQRAGVKA